MSTAVEAPRLAAWIRRAAEEARPLLVERLLRLTAVDAPSGDPQGLARAADAFAAEVEELGAAARRATVGGIPQLEASFGAEAGDHVLVLCHYDTVWPAGTAAGRPARCKSDRVFGPGSFDMRGGIVAVLEALRIVGRERLPAPVWLLMTGDEETGSSTSHERIVALASGARLVLVPEPPLPGGGLKTARKGWSAYGIDVHGRAAHAGLEPERGVSAIDELVDTLRDVSALASPARGTTVNVGTVAGGTSVNVLAERASAQIEVRASRPDEQRRVDEALRSLRARRAGASVEVVRLHGRPPMERTPGVAAAAARARELARLLGFELGEGAAGGTSDANLVAPLGVPVLDGLGPEGGGAHALDEHVLIDSLVERTALIALLLASA
ncbi:MAG TPA: M20/M25/M40 family metallo-hydrolase [Thermoleophilaceae bacterium]|nr:M20/M25/M40 family metallo-hydrolase [Thermoleophilaceae bacterium]